MVREWCDPNLKILHFKYLGLEYVASRYAELAKRRSPFNIEQGFGHQYSRNRDELASDIASYQQRAIPVALSSAP